MRKIARTQYCHPSIKNSAYWFLYQRYHDPIPRFSPFSMTNAASSDDSSPSNNDRDGEAAVEEVGPDVDLPAQKTTTSAHSPQPSTSTAHNLSRARSRLQRPNRITREIRELIISGGGTNGLALIGACHALEEKGKLRSVTRYVGTSVGALIAMILAIGYSPVVMYEILVQLPFADLNELNCDSVLMFVDTMGAIDGRRILRMLEVMMEKKDIPLALTFAQLRHRLKKELVITGFNMCSGKTVAFDAHTHPHMPILHACRISMSVPFIFRPIVYEDAMYVDGGFNTTAMGDLSSD